MPRVVVEFFHPYRLHQFIHLTQLLICSMINACTILYSYVTHHSSYLSSLGPYVLLTKNLLILLLAAPIHGVCMLLCARDARFFDLTLLWGRTRLPAFLTNLRFWKASSYSPLVVDLPDVKGHRRYGIAVCRVTRPHLAGSDRLGRRGVVRSRPKQSVAVNIEAGALP